MKTLTVVSWEYIVDGVDFVIVERDDLGMLCELLKGNAVPTKNLSLLGPGRYRQTWGGELVTDEVTGMLSEALKTNTTLTQLNLEGEKLEL